MVNKSVMWQKGKKSRPGRSPISTLNDAIAHALGLWLAALNVQYRDVRYIIPFIVQLGFFLTPIAYSSSLVPVGLQPLCINPMVGWKASAGRCSVSKPGRTARRLDIGDAALLAGG
jgi:lipopolysaccharide transport system permease protein